MFSVRRFWKVFRPPHEICRYTTIKHRADVSNPKNNQRSVCKVLSLPSLSLSLSLSLCVFFSRNYISSCIVREVPVVLCMYTQCFLAYVTSDPLYTTLWSAWPVVPVSSLFAVYSVLSFSLDLPAIKFYSVHCVPPFNMRPPVTPRA